jgi:hypothetical protein
MKTYIIDNTLHVEFTEAENHAVHAASWIAPTSRDGADAQHGRDLLQALDAIHKERFQRTGKPTPVKVKVETIQSRLEEQREAWAHDAARLTGYPLATCQFVARNTDTEGQALGVLEMASMSRRKPEAIIKEILSHK